MEGSGEGVPDEVTESAPRIQVLGVPKEKPGLLESPDISARAFGRRLADLPVIETDVKTEEVVVLDGDATLRAGTHLLAHLLQFSLFTKSIKKCFRIILSRTYGIYLVIARYT